MLYIVCACVQWCRRNERCFKSQSAAGRFPQQQNSEPSAQGPDESRHRVLSGPAWLPVTTSNIHIAQVLSPPLDSVWAVMIVYRQDKMEESRNCAVLCCVHILCTKTRCTHKQFLEMTSEFLLHTVNCKVLFLVLYVTFLCMKYLQNHWTHLRQIYMEDVFGPLLGWVWMLRSKSSGTNCLPIENTL